MNFVDCEFLSPQEKLRPVLLLLLGMSLCALPGLRALPRWVQWIYTFFNRRQFYDKIINDLVSLPLFRFGFGVTTSLIDKGMIEVLVPVGLTNRDVPNQQSKTGHPLCWCWFFPVLRMFGAPRGGKSPFHGQLFRCFVRMGSFPLVGTTTFVCRFYL